DGCFTHIPTSPLTLVEFLAQRLVPRVLVEAPAFDVVPKRQVHSRIQKSERAARSCHPNERDARGGLKVGYYTLLASGCLIKSDPPSGASTTARYRLGRAKPVTVTLARLRQGYRRTSLRRRSR